MKMELDLLHVVKLMRKRAWLIVLFVCAAAALVAFVTVKYMKPVYEASAKMIVNKTSETPGNPQIDLNTVSLNIKLIDTYKEVIKSPAIMDIVASRLPEYKLTAKQLVDNVKISSVKETQVLSLSYEDSTFDKAATIVNTVLTVAKEQIPLIMKEDNVSILNEAKQNGQARPIKPNLQMNIVVGVVVAFVLILGIVVIIDHLDDTIRSEEDVATELGLPTLTLVAKLRRADVRTSKSKTSRNKVGETANATISS